MKIYNLNAFKNGVKLTLLTSTLIVTLSGCHKKEFNSYSTTNGNVNVTNINIINEYEYNGVKHETNNNETTVNNNYGGTTNTPTNDPTPVPTKKPTPTPMPTKAPTPTLAPKNTSVNDEKDILNYFKNKLVDLNETADKQDVEEIKEKGSKTIESYNNFINGKSSLFGKKFSELSKATQDQIKSDRDTLKELIDKLYEDNKENIDKVKDAIDETIEQDKKNIQYILDLFKNK